MTPYARVASPSGKAHLAPRDTLIPVCTAGRTTGPLLETADGTLPLCKNCEKIDSRPGPQRAPRIPYADKAVARAAERAASQTPAMRPEPSLPAADTDAAETGRDPKPCGDPSRSAAPQTPAGGEPAAAARPSSSPDRTIQELQAALDAYHATCGLGRDPGPIETSPARPRFARPWWLRLGRKGGGE